MWHSDGALVLLVQITTWYTIKFKILFVIQQINAYFVSAYDHFTTVLLLCLQSLHNAYRPLNMISTVEGYFQYILFHHGWPAVMKITHHVHVWRIA